MEMMEIRAAGSISFSCRYYTAAPAVKVLDRRPSPESATVRAAQRPYPLQVTRLRRFTAIYEAIMEQEHDQLCFLHLTLHLILLRQCQCLSCEPLSFGVIIRRIPVVSVCCNTQLPEKPECFQEQQGTGYLLVHDTLELA
jgi:hypothetical protein